MTGMEGASTCHWKDGRHPVMEWVLHEVALVAAARLQSQHAIARGACQRAARQIFASHILRNNSPCISDHSLALMRRYNGALMIDPACFTRRCATLANASSAGYLHANAPTTLDPTVLAACPGRIHAHVQEGCIGIRHHKQSSAAPRQTPSFLLSRGGFTQGTSSSPRFGVKFACLPWLCIHEMLVPEDR